MHAEGARPTASEKAQLLEEAVHPEVAADTLRTYRPYSWNAEELARRGRRCDPRSKCGREPYFKNGPAPKAKAPSTTTPT
jgi:hypothetical protein